MNDPQPDVDLAALDWGFTEAEGFSRPDWQAVQEFVKTSVSREDLPVAWRLIARRWVEELARNLGGESKTYESPSFICLCDAGPSVAEALLRHGETVLETVRANLQSAAWTGFYVKHVLLVFADQDDYAAYVSYFYPDGHFASSGGMFLRGGYAHVAMPYVNAWSAARTLTHELAHNLVCHLPLPRWLDEGVAVHAEQLMSRRPVLDRDMADRHHAFWTEKNIQTFWAGKSFFIPGESNELSYSLAHVLVCLLCEKGERFIAFVQNANWRDAGQEAALQIFDRDLGAIASEFLGPGNWRPQRAAIAQMTGKKSQGGQASPSILVAMTNTHI